MLKIEFLIFLSILLSVCIVSATGDFNCSVTASGSCGGDNVTVIYLENDTGGYLNAHAQNVSVGTYDYVVCCNSSSTVLNVCGEGVFLRLNATSDSHVQRGDYSGPSIVYGVDVCLKVSPGYFNCTYVDDNCPADRECFASMASSNASTNNNTDCHIGPCSAYRRKICCRQVTDVNVTYQDPTPGNNSRQYSNSVVINVTVVTDTSISADTCILEWTEVGVSTANETMEMVGSGSSVTCNITKTTNDATNYTFKVYANDSSNVFDSENMRQFRENDEPPKVVLSSPANYSNTTDRTPEFGWNAPADPDGDSPLQYDINITCHPDCSDDNRFLAKESGTTYTPGKELQYFGDDNNYYNWSVRAWDGYEYGEWSDIWLLEIYTNVTVSLINDTVDFGEELFVGFTADTLDNDPYPFALRNTGNCMIDVNISSSDLLWDTASQPTDYFNYSVNWSVGEEGAFNWSGSQTSEVNMPQVDQNVTFMDYLNYSSGNSTAEIEIYMEVPPNEEAGTKSSVIVFTGWYVG